MPVRSSELTRRFRLRGSVVAAALAPVFVLVCSPRMALAGASDKARESATTSISEVEAASQKLSASVKPRPPKNPAQLIANAELHYRTGQYAVAIDQLSQVVELHRQGKVSASTDADAQYLLGESYFATGQLYSARRHFETVTDQAENPAFAGLGGPAASRLVDIALQIQRQETLPDVLARVDKILARARNDALHYARAKVLFAMGRYHESRVQAEAVTGSTLYAQRAAYLRGVAMMKEAQEAAGVKEAPAPPSPEAADSPVPGPEVAPAAPASPQVAEKKPDYRDAIAAFEKATTVASERSDERENSQRILDLSWLAVARLHYESGKFSDAAVAYQKLPRTSEYFPLALFELAWTYVRLGEYDRGQRALEALTVLNPGLIDGADAELLRGDLLLRAGRFQKAADAYEQVRTKYDPLRLQVADYLATHDDPAIFYDKLTAAEIETGHELPALAVDWAREEAEEERVFAIVDDVARSRSLVKRSRRMVTLLRASLGSTSRAKVFPEIQTQLESVVALLNQLAVARLTLAQGMDTVATDDDAELNQTRALRRKLMNRLATVPTNPGDFSVREANAQKSWNKMSQTLQRLQLEADHLSALVNGLRRMIAEASRFGLKGDEAALERFKEELSDNEADLADYFKRIEVLREQVEVGRVQTGFGDELFEGDDEVRKQFREYFGKEVSLAAGGRDRDEREYSGSIKPVLARLATIEGRLESLRAQLDERAKEEAQKMSAVVETEASALEVYAGQLDTMDQHARLLVGEVARSNFIKVRDRLKDVVMRADVGLVQEAWEVREEQRHRVRELLRERANEERFINDELREVLDDASEGER